MRVEQALKALEQNGKPQLLLIAVLCAAAALLGLMLLRDPAPAAADPAPITTAAPVSDRQARIETRLREQVEEMIGAIVGRDNVRAVVSVEIEPDQTRQVTEAGDSGTNSTETTTIRSSGQIRRLTVSVMVDGRHVEGPDGARYQPRSKAELARFTRLAQGAVGFDAMRGDSLTVETGVFRHGGCVPAVRACPPRRHSCARRTVPDPADVRTARARRDTRARTRCGAIAAGRLRDLHKRYRAQPHASPCR